MNYEEVVAQWAAGELSGRLCIVNRQGYPNLSDFAARRADDERCREIASAIKLMEELDITYLYPIALLIVEEFVPQPDGHWNNAGHQKIGALVSDCIQRFIDSGSLADCDSINTPWPGNADLRHNWVARRRCEASRVRAIFTL